VIELRNPHPAFSNPTINEAVCDIHFTMPDDIDWNPSYYAKYFTLIQDEFSLFEPVFENSMKMRFHHDNRNHLIQLSESTLTINELSPYSGWGALKADIVKAWGIHQEVIGPVEIDAISLRYVNFIPAENENQRLIEWLSMNKYVAKAVLQTQPSFSQTLVTTPDGIRVMINTGEIENPSEHHHKRVFVLDLNAMFMVEKGSKVQIDPVVTQLHDEVIWKIFDSFRSDKLTSLLEQEIK